MAARAVAVRFSRAARAATGQVSPTRRRASAIFSGRMYYHNDTALRKDASTQSKSPSDENPIAASMAGSSTPTGHNTTVDDSKHAAFLGEADSDDGFESDVEINPEKYRHKFDDVNASGLHGQAGEGDEPIERERKHQEAMDATHSAYLGEADSDDAHQTDRDLHPEKYRHNIDDASPSGIHGQSGEGDEPWEKN